MNVEKERTKRKKIEIKPWGNEVKVTRKIRFQTSTRSSNAHSSTPSLPSLRVTTQRGKEPLWRARISSSFCQSGAWRGVLSSPKRELSSLSDNQELLNAMAT